MVGGFPRPSPAHVRPPATRVGGGRQDRYVRAALALTPDGGGELRVLSGGETAADGDRPATRPDATVGAGGALERSASPRWVLADVAATYPALLRSGVRLARCHDLASTEALLLAAEGDAAGAAAVTAARAGAATGAAEPAPQPSLFDDEPALAPPRSPDAAGRRGGLRRPSSARLDRIRAAPARLRPARGGRVGVVPGRRRDDRGRRALGRRHARPAAHRAPRAAAGVALATAGQAAGAGGGGRGGARRPAGQPRLPGRPAPVAAPRRPAGHLHPAARAAPPRASGGRSR